MDSAAIGAKIGSIHPPLFHIDIRQLGDACHILLINVGSNYNRYPVLQGRGYIASNISERTFSISFERPPGAGITSTPRTPTITRLPFAASATPEEARALNSQGMRLYEKGKLRAAAAKFRAISDEMRLSITEPGVR